jgi:two-component system, sensor histidine kinase and response regulator
VKPLTIVVVDDNEQNRLVIRYLFEPPDYRVLEAPDGLSGLELIRAEQPDCVLLDLAMPGLDGFEVLNRLRADPRAREIPVLVLTASAESTGSMELALRSGAVDYLTKPISPGRVAARVRGAIERRRLRQEMQELRGTFTSMLVHDLRSPLTIINGYLQLLEGSAEALPGKHRRYLTSIREACTRMIRLIGDILDVSKLEEGKLALEREPVDLVALSGEIVERLGPVATQHSVLLVFEPAVASLTVLADPRRLEQVLMNLLGNALKFTPSGGRIGVTLDSDGVGALVTVSDSGPGIAAHEMPLLFEKFSQTSAAKGARGPGTGLGLVICRHLIEAHGGRIWAESEPGHGSRFIFRLPLPEPS